jgi:arylsulfatase A-like enzyme
MDAEQLNIVMIMTDQQRADHVGWAQNAQLATPNLDRIAEGWAFQRCLTANPICMPARCALLTGRYTRQIHALHMSGDLDRSIPNYPQALQRAGYRTAAVGKLHLNQTWRWGRGRGNGLNLHAMHEEMKSYGFDHVWEACGKQLAVANFCDYAAELASKGTLETFRDHTVARGPNTVWAADALFTGEPWPLAEADYPDIRIGDEAVRYIEQHDRTSAAQPFFLLSSFLSPHPPFDPPQRFLDAVPYEENDDFIQCPDSPAMDAATRQRLWKLRRAYKAMIGVIDEQVGRIFHALETKGILDNTVILFVSDHGEMLGDHSCIQKSIHWRGAVEVPCAIRHPHHLDRARYHQPIELTDLTATLLAAAGLDPHAALSEPWPGFRDIIPGRSLLPVMQGKTAPVREFAFCEYNNSWSLLHSEEFAYVRFHSPDAPQRELLFNYKDDPDECRNLATDPAHAAILARHRDYLFNLLESHPPVQSNWAEAYLQ